MRDLVLTPVVVAIWAIDTYRRRAGRTDGPRYGTWYWNRWWRIGYSGPYQFGWLYKRRGLRPLDILIPHRQVWRALR